MLLAVAFVVLMVMFGNNPVDEWRAEQLKYGKDPFVREINKFNEEKSQSGTTDPYKPPPGATLYRLPPGEGVIPKEKPYSVPGHEEAVRPAPDIPISQWDSPYPNHMIAPNTGYNSGMQNNVILPETGGTSIVPGGRPRR